MKLCDLCDRILDPDKDVFFNVRLAARSSARRVL